MDWELRSLIADGRKLFKNLLVFILGNKKRPDLDVLCLSNSKNRGWETSSNIAVSLRFTTLAYRWSPCSYHKGRDYR